MSYVKKIIGQDERLVGIAELHWVYLLRGLFAFCICIGFGWAADFIIMKALSLIYIPAKGTDDVPLLGLGMWMLPLGAIAGGFILVFYILKVLTTEVALTSKRIIHKTGWLFVKVREIDIEEISGENMDMGYFGRFWGYSYIILDCRFIGDITLPAIAKPAVFMKALHAMRSEVTAILPTGKGGKAIPAVIQVEQPDPSTNPAYDLMKPQAPSPPSLPENHVAATSTSGTTNPSAISENESDGHDIDHETEILKLQIEKLGLEVQLKDKEFAAHAAEEKKQPDTSSADVAQIIKDALPAMVDQITDELVSKGVIPSDSAHHPDENMGKRVQSDDLLNSFDHAVSTEEPSLKPSTKNEPLTP